MTTPQDRSRKRGRDNEYQLVHLLEKHNIQAMRVPLSGSIRGLPGDVVSEEYSLLLEAKVYRVFEKNAVGSRYMQINLAWLDKIELEAKGRKMKHAAVVIRGEKLKRRYVILGFEEYISLIKSSK
jgi:hypothetical protein